MKNHHLTSHEKEMVSTLWSNKIRNSETLTNIQLLKLRPNEKTKTILDVLNFIIKFDLGQSAYATKLVRRCQTKIVIS